MEDCVKNAVAPVIGHSLQEVAEFYFRANLFRTEESYGFLHILVFVIRNMI